MPMATRQAAMVAYIDNFKLMMIMVIAGLPLVLLLRKPAAGSARSSRRCGVNWEGEWNHAARK